MSAFKDGLPFFGDVFDLKELPIPKGSCVLIHRYPGDMGVPHTPGDPNCWCSPMALTYEMQHELHPGALWAEMERFLRVH